MVDDEVIEALNGQDWETILPNLLIHERNRMYGKTLPGPYTPGDFGQIAYERIYKGVRDWNPSSDIYNYLCGVVDSLISAATKSKENKILQLDVQNHDVKGPSNPYEDIIGAELINEIAEDIKGDEDLELLFICITEFKKTKPEEIQEELNWEKTKINNLKKKLKRRVMKIQEKRADT